MKKGLEPQRGMSLISSPSDKLETATRLMGYSMGLRNSASVRVAKQTCALCIPRTLAVYPRASHAHVPLVVVRGGSGHFLVPPPMAAVVEMSQMLPLQSVQLQRWYPQVNSHSQHPYSGASPEVPRAAPKSPHCPVHLTHFLSIPCSQGAQRGWKVLRRGNLCRRPQIGGTALPATGTPSRCAVQVRPSAVPAGGPGAGGAVVPLRFVTRVECSASGALFPCPKTPARAWARVRVIDAHATDGQGAPLGRVHVCWSFFVQDRGPRLHQIVTSRAA